MSYINFCKFKPKFSNLENYFVFINNRNNEVDMKNSVEIKETEETLETLHLKCNQIKAQKNIKMVKRKLSEYLSASKYGENR